MKKTIKSIIILLSLFLLFSCLTTEKKEKKPFTYSHILILKDGNEYKGVLKDINNENIVFEIDGKERIWKRGEVNRIQFHKKRLYEDINNVEEINDPEIQDIWNLSKKWKMSQDMQIVILLDKTIIEFVGDNKIIIRIKKAIKILNEEGKNFSTQYFHYFKDDSTARLLYGITILPDGEIRSIEESAINDEPVNNNIPHYDILRRIKFGLKDIDVGSVFVWEAEIIKEWDFLKHPFLIEKELASYYRVEKRIIKIKAPNNMKINYYIYKGLIPFKRPFIKKQRIKNSITYSLEQNNAIEYIDDENNSPSDSLIYPKFYASPDINWKELNNTYHKRFFEKPVSDDIVKLSLEIVKEVKSVKKRLNLLYDYINRKINIADVPMHQFYFIPLDENKLTSMQSLNILDKSYLFMRMAEALEIPVNLFFYRNNHKNNIVDKCPSLKQFDFVVCEAIVDNKPMFYSFINQNFAAGQTYYSVSNAQALRISQKESGIVFLRKIPSDYNRYEYDYKCTLSEDNTLHINKTTTIFGSSQAIWRAKRFLSNEELDKYMKSRVASLGNDIFLEDYKFINKLDDFEKPVVINEKIKVNNYSFSSGKNIKLLKIPDLKFNAGSVSKTDRVLPYDMGTTMETHYKLSLTFPDKYKVEYLPESLSLSCDGFSFIGDYKINKNKIFVDTHTIYKKALIPVSQYKKLKDWMEQRAKLTDKWILLGDAK